MTLVESLKERKARYQARAESTERMIVGSAISRRLMRSRQVAVLISDISGNILDASPAAEILLDRGLPEIKLTGWRNMTHPDDLPLDQAFASRCTSGELVGYTIKKRYLDRERNEIPVQIHVMKINGGEIPTGIYVCFLNRLPNPLEEAEMVDISPTEDSVDAE